jgi:SAM-dependent methyltransferase
MQPTEPGNPAAGEAKNWVENLFRAPLPLHDGVYLAAMPGASENEIHTSGAFSQKWTTLPQTQSDEDEGWKQYQFRWYMRCYGFESEAELAAFVRTRSLILDAGCGPGHKAAWLARMNPDAKVVGMDLSDSVYVAARRYADVPNLHFVKGDIAATPFRDGPFDFINCDQVLHHTDCPPATSAEFHRLITHDGVLHTYVYARKALPRELLDEHLREYCKSLDDGQLWELSDQLTQLGKTLTELDITIDVPAMPALGIPGGKTDLQRFIYWNFIKCFWNPEHGFEASKYVNFDWYSPSTAYRYDRDEFVEMLRTAGFEPEFLHSEEACHSGRFRA